jgi:hypothetical protein
MRECLTDLYLRLVRRERRMPACGQVHSLHAAGVGGRGKGPSEQGVRTVGDYVHVHLGERQS